MRSDQQAHDYAGAGHSHRLMLGCGFLWLSRADRPTAGRIKPFDEPRLPDYLLAQFAASMVSSTGGTSPPLRNQPSGDCG
jgi:hypothetical protein